MQVSEEQLAFSDFDKLTKPEEHIDKHGFFFQGRAFMLTYKTHLDKDKYITGFKQLVAPHDIKFIRLAHETGSHKEGEDPYDHTHVVVEFDKRVQIKNCRKFDIDGIHPHFKPIRTTGTHLLNAKKYLAKEDKSNSDLLAEDPSEKNRAIIYGIIACSSFLEALLNYGSCKSALEIERIYSAKNDSLVDLPLIDIKLYLWQEYIIKYVLTSTDERKIFWFWEDIGNVGKSIFANWLEQEFTEKRVAILDTIGNERDFAHNMGIFCDQGWGRQPKPILIFDLPRSYADRDYIYTSIERVGNARLTRTKYTGGKLKFHHPIKIVFANFYPHLETCSSDRWEIFDIRRMFNEEFPVTKKEESFDLLHI